MKSFLFGFTSLQLDVTLPGKFARTTAEGAVTTVTAATSSAFAGKGGIYVEDHCIMTDCDGGVEPHVSATSVEDQEWLWRTSSEIVGLKDPYDHRFNL